MDRGDSPKKLVLNGNFCGWGLGQNAPGKGRVLVALVKDTSKPIDCPFFKDKKGSSKNKTSQAEVAVVEVGEIVALEKLP